MNIEVARIYRLDSEGSVKAFVDLQFGEEFLVLGFKVIDGKDGMFVGMPSQAGKNGRFYNTFLPLTDDIKQQITDLILGAYQE